MNSPKEIFDNMAKQIEADPSLIEGEKVIIQFNVTGDNGGKWFADSTGDKVVIDEGERDNPNVTITVSDDNFMKIKGGKLNPKVAVMSRKLKLEGDIALAMRLQKLIG